MGVGVMLRISRALHDDVIAHCRNKYPKEACGLLAGDASWRVTHVYPMTNVEDSAIGYSMDPKEQLQVEKQMRIRKQRMLAIFHSHTASDAYPSSVDVSLAISPDVSYVLVSLKDREHPAFRSYRMDGTTITKEDVLVGASFGWNKTGMREPGIMAAPTVMVDVRDMLCAQALAIVAQDVGRLQAGETAAVRYNTDDVKRDLLAWASDRGYHVDTAIAGTLHIRIEHR